MIAISAFPSERTRAGPSPDGRNPEINPATVAMLRMGMEADGDGRDWRTARRSCMSSIVVSESLACLALGGKGREVEDLFLHGTLLHWHCMAWHGIICIVCIVFICMSGGDMGRDGAGGLVDRWCGCSADMGV